MPIECPIALSQLDTQQFGQLDYDVMQHVFSCQKEIGRLADERIYQADLASRLSEAGFETACEVPVHACFGSFVKTYYLDLVVNQGAVYELKSVTKLVPEHMAQLMNYLLMLGAAHGKLVNFRTVSVTSRFVNAPIGIESRRQFKVDRTRWKGGEPFFDLVLSLLRDWGVGLELQLYHQAIVYHLGGEALVARNLPLTRGSIPLGSQRFHLNAEDGAFRLTAFGDSMPRYAEEIGRLISLSPLKAIHWINISLRQVSMVTIQKQ